jgi:hypothetical protein
MVKPQQKLKKADESLILVVGEYTLGTHTIPNGRNRILKSILVLTLLVLKKEDSFLLRLITRKFLNVPEAVMSKAIPT